MMQYKAKMPDYANRPQRIHDSLDRVRWCRNQFGSESLFTNYGRWHRYKGYIYFSDQRDYVLYTLRWS